MKTDSSKLKLEYRDKLYYKKYAYKARMKVPGVYWFIKKYDNLWDYRERLEHFKFYFPSNCSNDNILEKMISLIQDTKKNDDFTIRIENSVVICYCNDFKFLKKSVESIGVKVDYYKIELISSGVIKFKNAPPAEYRIFFNGSSKITNEEKQELWQYINTNDNITPSNATARWLDRTYPWLHNTWCSPTYHLNVNGQDTVTYLYLKYSEFLGRNCRLEKLEK